MKEKAKKRLTSIAVVCAMMFSAFICFDNGTLKSRAAEPGVSYCSYVQGLTWIDWKKNGTMSGTTGRAKRMEALKIKLVSKPVSGSVTYRTYIGGDGWQPWASDGEVSGAVNESKQIEAVEIKLTKNMAKQYDIYYRAHVQSKGWLSWTLNGKAAGTTGMDRRVEAIQIRLVKKGGSAPGDTSLAYLSYSDSIYSNTKDDVAKLLKDVGFFNVGENIERRATYSLYDINGDGNKELLISTKHYDHDKDTGEEDSFRLFTVVNGSVKEVKLPEKGRTRYDFIILEDNTLCIPFAPNHPYADSPDYFFYKLTGDGSLKQIKAYEQVWGGYYGTTVDYYCITHGKATLRLAGLYGKLFMESAVEQGLENRVTGIDKDDL